MCWSRGSDLLKSNVFWFIALGGVLIASVAAALFLRQAPASGVSVFLDGELVESLDLSAVVAPYSFTIEGEYGFNVIEVERGRVCVSGADCPDCYCIRQGWLSGGVVPIVCLPHKLVIRPIGNSLRGADAIDVLVG